MIKISVIVPVYNVEKYLNKCLDSLLTQTFNEYEIICVNDGSTDSSKEILDLYKKDFPQKIKVINKINGGLSDARNYGLLKAKGDYILFIDSDDWVENTLLEKLYSKAIKSNSDLVVCGFRRVSIENKILSVEQTNLKEVYSSKEALVKLAPAAWNKMFKRTLFIDNKIEFPLDLWYEDLSVTTKIIMNASNITTIDEVLINYLQREDSISYTYNEKVNDIFLILEDIYFYSKNNDFLKKYHTEIEYIFIVHIIFAHLFRSARLSRVQLKHEIKNTKRFIEKYFPVYYKNKNISNNFNLLYKLLIVLSIQAYRYNVYFYILKVYYYINGRIFNFKKW